MQAVQQHYAGVLLYIGLVGFIVDNQLAANALYVLLICMLHIMYAWSRFITCCFIHYEKMFTYIFGTLILFSLRAIFF